MATSKTYHGATKDDAVAQAAADLGCSPPEVDVIEVVMRSSAEGAPASCEVRVRLPEALQGNDDTAILEGFRRPRAAKAAEALPAAPVRPAEPARAAPPREPTRAAPVPADETAASPELVSRAEAFLRELLAHMGVSARLDTNLEGENINIEIVADKGVGGLLIGRQGQTLDAIQYLVNRVVLPGAAVRGRIYLDTEGYREKYRRKIEELAHKYRDEALRAGKPVTLEEFSSRDRWIIHQALLDDPRVTTRSVGEEDDRKLMIIPRR
ncbi:MAG: KH domain-containing protein [bacterium]